MVALLVFFLIPAYFISASRMKFFAENLSSQNEGERLSGISGRIIKKEFKKEKYRYTVKLDRPSDLRGYGLLITDNFDLPMDGRIVADCTTMRVTGAENEGGFDSEVYYGSHGISLVAWIEDVKVIERGFFAYELLYELRERIAAVYANTLPGEEGGLLSAMALGDKSELSNDVRTLFSDSGLAHLLAVSGVQLRIYGLHILKETRCLGGFVRFQI